jgi:hypothetical protein
VTTKTLIAVCGRATYMAGLAASLQANPDLEVIRVRAAPSELSASLDTLAPAVVVIDLVETPGGLAVSLVRDRPGLLLIGIDPGSNEGLILSGHAAPAPSAADLVKVIRRETRP